MVKNVLCSLAVMLILATPSTRAQTPDEAGKLQEQIELLKLENELLKMENETLKKENEILQSGKAKTKNAIKPDTQPTLSELLTNGTIVRGDYVFLTGDKSNGDWSLTIKERKGDDFKGKYTVKGNGPGAEIDVKGKIKGNRFVFNSEQYSTKLQFTAAGALKNDVIDIDWVSKDGRANLRAKAPK